MTLNNFFLPFKWGLFLLGYLMPTNKKLWAFGSRNGKFIDNPKYFFDFVTSKYCEIDCVWISSDAETIAFLNEKGYMAYATWSPMGVWYALRASCFIYAFDSNDINFYCSSNSKLINLYHGIPLKKIEFDTCVGASAQVYHPKTLLQSIRSRIAYAPKWQKIDLFQIPSQSLKSIHESAFNRLIKYYQFGLNPRLLPLTTEPKTSLLEEENSAEVDQMFKRFSDVIVFMPTWRVGNPNILSEAFPNLDLLNDILRERDTLLVLKMHLYTVSELSEYSNIKLFPTDLDIYPILSKVDILITDYSSIAIDFDLIQGTTIFYPFDYDRYCTSSSDGFYFDYEEFTNSSKVSSFDELLSLLKIRNLNDCCLGEVVSKAVWGAKQNLSVLESNEQLIINIKRIVG